MKFLTFLLILIATLSVPLAHAGEPKRSRVIDFEDEVVEGLNKRPLDSLSQISEKDKRRRRPHLYKKRVGFKTETSDTIRELRYVQ
jgi:hypothetical protein